MKATMKRIIPFLAILLCPLAAHADLIKQSATGGYTRTFLMTDAASPALGKTGLTVVVKIRKQGGAYTATTNAATEVDSTNDPGRYQIVLTTTEVNTLGLLDYAFTATGGNPDGAHDQVVAFDPNDAASLGLTQVAKIATNAADSPNTVTEQANAASSATGIASANLILAKFLFDTSSFVKAATQTLPTTPPAGYGGGGGGGSDPWLTFLPGTYGPGSAGFILGNGLGVKATAVGTSPATAQIAALLAAQSTVSVTIPRGRKGLTAPLRLDFSGVIFTIPLNTPTLVPQTIYEILVNGGYAP